jgi:hypothetical protein
VLVAFDVALVDRRPAKLGGGHAMTTPHEPGTPHYPEPPDLMEARLIEEITQLEAQVGLDLRNPSTTVSLRAASTETLGRQADGMTGSRTSTAGSPCAAGEPAGNSCRR